MKNVGTDPHPNWTPLSSGKYRPFELNNGQLKNLPPSLKYFLRVSSGWNKTHKVLKRFSIVNVRGQQVLQAVRWVLQSKIMWLADCSSALQMHLGASRCIEHAPAVQACTKADDVRS